MNKIVVSTPMSRTSPFSAMEVGEKIKLDLWKSTDSYPYHIEQFETFVNGGTLNRKNLEEFARKNGYHNEIKARYNSYSKLKKHYERKFNKLKRKKKCSEFKLQKFRDLITHFKMKLGDLSDKSPDKLI